MTNITALSTAKIPAKTTKAILTLVPWIMQHQIRLYLFIFATLMDLVGGATTFNIMTLGIMTLSITKFRIMKFSITIKCDTQHNDT